MKLFNRIKNSIQNIKVEANYLKFISDDELILKIQKLKKRFYNDQNQFADFSLSKREKEENKLLDTLLIEWFAVVQEMSFRKIGLRHFDTQLMAGIYLHEGKIVEMKTGEGKTLASTLSVSLNALTKKGVHIVTVNDYLAERDKNWMGKIYNGLDLTVGLIKTGSQGVEKKISYDSDITYLTNSELVFDYLRDTCSIYSNELVQRTFNYCIIDEIDSILIDEARTPLILSSTQGESNFKKLGFAKLISNELQKDIDFEIDEKRREINLLEYGYLKVNKRLGKSSLFEIEDPWILDILNALKAKYLFKLNKDYIVLNNKIAIVDEFTGRVMEDRRWSLGIHEAIEMKENVEIGKMTKTKTSITYQNFFPLYPKLCGMTGTAKTAEKELKEIYNLQVVVLPTAKPMLRKDLSDLVYQTELAKWKAVLVKAQNCYSQGQPILIGTGSVEKSEFLSDLFKVANLPHQVLNAKPENINRESEIVAQAGEPYAITIATNMAGRGTDILLGGNTNFKMKQLFINLFIENQSIDVIFERYELQDFSPQKEKIKKILTQIFDEYKIKNLDDNNLGLLKNDILNLPYSLEICSFSFKELYDIFYSNLYQKCKKKNDFVKNVGGLFVLGTERNESRRIDNQLRGRAGRQGDPGFSQFFVSLDDELIKIFGGNNFGELIKSFMQDEATPLESDYLTYSLENAQKKIESYNYDIRKNVFQYDELVNLQRKTLFAIRKFILEKKNYNDLALDYLRLTIYNEKKNFESRGFLKLFVEPFFFNTEMTLGHFSSYKLNQIYQEENNLKSFGFFKKDIEFSPKFQKQLDQELLISADLRISETNAYQSGYLQEMQSFVVLKLIDNYWTEHLERLNYIRETVNWRSYGQQNPLIEYNLEATKSFRAILYEIRKSMVYFYFEHPSMLFKYNYHY